MKKLKNFLLPIIVIFFIAGCNKAQDMKPADIARDTVETSTNETPEDIFQRNYEALPVVKQFFSPFKEVSERESYSKLYKRCISTYGAHRDSYVRGHKHSGIDLKGTHDEKVYPVAPGIIMDIHLGFPHRTIVIIHKLDSADYIYSTYKHVEGISVQVGDVVDENTAIARLFTKEEQREAKFGVNHLHFEIKHDISDGGRASFTSMDMETLNNYHYDPLVYMKEMMK